ncbi:uncharacterized protein [Clytia hemisphaerica]|uniref:uncharacterized protein isoform X2 n=1 Tax=Clytia hemisphaerica TaxID=252671 RepID=UPI0034D422BE
MMSSTQNYRALVEFHSMNKNYAPPMYHLQQDSMELPCNYFCSLVVCDKTFSTSQAFPSPDAAETEAAKLACREFQLLESQPPINQKSFVQDEDYDKYYQQQKGNNDFFQGNGFHNEQRGYHRDKPRYEPYQNKQIRTKSFDNQVNHKPKSKIQQQNKSQYQIDSATKSKSQVHHKSPSQPYQRNDDYQQSNQPQPTHQKQAQQKPEKKVYPDLRHRLKTLPVDSSLAIYHSDPIKVSTIGEVWKYMHGDVLANAFKTILTMVAQEEKTEALPRWSHTQIEERVNNHNLYAGECTFKNQTFKSIAPMMSKKQAELSATEDCLRKLGYFQELPTSEYTIQPYKGGRVMYSNQKQIGPLAVLNNINIMFCFANSGSIRTKKIKDSSGEFKYQAFYTLDDQLFVSQPTHSGYYEAKSQVFRMVLKRYNITLDSQLKSQYVFAGLNRDFFQAKYWQRNCPNSRTPSQNKGWLHRSYIDPAFAYDGQQVDIKALKDAMGAIFVLGAKTEVNSHEYFIKQPPALQCQPLQEIQDLMVCHVGSNSDFLPNAALLGNKDFSVPLYVQDEKLFCKKRGCEVKLLPGHNISGLESEYIVSPTNDVYLKAISCNDLFFPNHIQPVVRSCCVILIMHDPLAGDLPYVLFMRSAANTGFASKTQYLSDYLTQLIKGNSQAALDITSLTENIGLWTDPELECLSVMSMDSMFELFSNFGRYDSRWNEVFMQPPTEDLQSLMERCKKELKSRKSSKKKTPKKKEPELPWELPRYKFKSRLHTQGPFIEDTVLCAQRGFRNMTGIHLKQGDFTNMPFVDVPVEQQFTRGAFDRYYVWARSFNYAEKDNYFDTTCIALNSEEWLENCEEMKMKKTKTSNKMMKSSTNPRRNTW